MKPAHFLERVCSTHQHNENRNTDTGDTDCVSTRTEGDHIKEKYAGWRNKSPGPANGYSRAWKALCGKDAFITNMNLRFVENQKECRHGIIRVALPHHEKDIFHRHAAVSPFHQPHCSIPALLLLNFVVIASFDAAKDHLYD